MKIKSLYISIVICFYTSIILSCNKVDDTYAVNIVINKPIPNQVVSKNKVMPIDVVITRANNAVIHNIIVDITDSNGTRLDNLITKHYHTSGTATYSDTTYIPKTAGNFKLKVTSTDDNDIQPNIKEIGFSVN